MEEKTRVLTVPPPLLPRIRLFHFSVVISQTWMIMKSSKPVTITTQEKITTSSRTSQTRSAYSPLTPRFSEGGSRTQSSPGRRGKMTRNLKVTDIPDTRAGFLPSEHPEVGISSIQTFPQFPNCQEKSRFFCYRI